ncbi:GNAT family N-acetyltransferase [Micromonospora orduensis]|uniref:bifunctional acetate--CoA ligase family protein/GNAT family N-acetyltransferase n=1 Tax=Micromonospora orduensis TaxID=1420891 RepID=UPI001FCC8CAC|nr:GNAT family N-acetyltransferase [Micromonospora orduensis]
MTATAASTPATSTTVTTDAAAAARELAGVDALTADGGIVRIRPVQPADRPELTALYGRAGIDSLRMRFFVAPGPAMIASEIDRLCRRALPRHEAFVAEQAGTVVGVASYERGSAAERRAEFAVFVDEKQRGRGVGTLLLEHLAAAARAQGVDELVGEVLPGNSRMLKVARDLTSGLQSRLDHGVVDVALTTGADEAAQLAVDERERIAERASLRPLLAPTSIAVVGAGRRPGGIGHETLQALREYGFTGDLYAVNPHATAIAGVPAYPSFAHLPAPVDLAVIAVPAEAVAGVVAEAGAAGVRAAVVLGSGFGEAGAQGRARQAEMVRLARAHGIRLVGPNCLGIVNTDPAVRLNASFTPAAPFRGGLAVASQSGAVGIALLDLTARAGCGVSTFVSLGNKADVSGNDLLAYWFDDPATTAVALYLESFGNPRKFARTVRALARRKPVLAVKSGRSTAGARAGASHTAAAAAPDVAVEALFAQAGVVRVDHLGDLMDAARMLTGQPLPAGERLAVVGNAGGVNVLAADAAEAAGLRVPSLSPGLRERLAGVAPDAAGHDSPLDLGAAATPAAFAKTVEALAVSGEVDSLLVVVAATRTNDVPATLAAITPVVDAHPGLTVAAVVIGLPAAQPTFGERRTPIFDLPERAVRALGHATRYAAWRREPLGARPALPDVDTAAVRTAVAQGLVAGAGWQPYERAAAILAGYGIPLVTSVTAGSKDDAVLAAQRIGYPVVLKSADPDLVHKSDTGAVQLNLVDAAAVRAAYRAVTAAGGTECGALVQPMVRGQVELVAGVVHDPLFGSLVMAGLGGVHTDLLGDRTFRLVPMTDRDAERMWRSLRAAPLLTGYRGAPPVDTAAIENLLLRLGRLAEEVPEVAELDLNPVLVGPDGALAVDAKLRLAPVGAEPDPVLRQLRQPE